jgi:RNA polymerase sigma-70 factor (ECF subfamily)
MGLRLRRQPAARDDTGGDAAGDEDAIVLRALLDPRAFAPLYERYVDLIYRHCYRRLGEPEAARDLTSIVFHKALVGLSSYHGGSFKAWLFRIADNALTDALRASRPVASLDDDVERSDPAPGPEEQAMAAFDRHQLRRALAELPEEWRRVVELRLDGFSCAEVAEILGNGRTAEWVRQIHHRAMQRLRQTLLAAAPTKGGAR